MVMLGCTPRNCDSVTVPTIPSSRLIAKHSSVPTNVTRRTRTGIAYQRARLLGAGLTSLNYTMNKRPAGLRPETDEAGCPHMDGRGRCPCFHFALGAAFVVGKLWASRLRDISLG